MPARSTLLQRVLFHVQRQLTANAVVQESAFLQDRALNGANREVDVVIRSRVGEHDLVVSVECLDQKRAASVEWVEQMAEKHKSLPTSKLVLVSARGFSKMRHRKADSLGIDAYSLEEAGETDWKGLIGNGARPSFDLFAFRILRCGLVFVEDNTHEYAASPYVRIFNDDGTCIGTLNDVVRTNTDGSDRFIEKAIQYARRRRVLFRRGIADAFRPFSPKTPPRSATKWRRFACTLKRGSSPPWN